MPEVSTTSHSCRECATLLGGFWHVPRAGALIPESWRDRLSALVARNRYRCFGKSDYCALLTPEQRAAAGAV